MYYLGTWTLGEEFWGSLLSETSAATSAVASATADVSASRSWMFTSTFAVEVSSSTRWDFLVQWLHLRIPTTQRFRPCS